MQSPVPLSYNETTPSERANEMLALSKGQVPTREQVLKKQQSLKRLTRLETGKNDRAGDEIFVDVCVLEPNEVQYQNNSVCIVLSVMCGGVL